MAVLVASPAVTLTVLSFWVTSTLVGAPTPPTGALSLVVGVLVGFVLLLFEYLLAPYRGVLSFSPHLHVCFLDEVCLDRGVACAGVDSVGGSQVSKGWVH